MRTTAHYNGHRSSTTAPVDPFGNNQLTTSILHRGVFLLTVIFVIWIFRQEEESLVKTRNHSNDDHHVFVSHNLCLDDDEDNENRNSIQQQPTTCLCFDPLIPRKRYDNAWDAHREVMLQDVAYAASLELEHAQELDVVLYGDSITEHFNGTRSMGRIPVAKYRTVFESYFDKQQHSSFSNESSTSSARLQGMALGTSGDVSVELLWNLQNGLLPDSLQPNVIFILIGTNDIGRTGCSKQTTLAGILQVAEYITGQRPQTPLIIHGLLPRNDVYKDENNQDDYSLGRYWQQILWINRELKRFCNLRENWHYMDSAKLFLEKIPDAEHPENDAKGSYRIKKEYMTDALHPSVAGYEAWGARIVAKVQKVMQRQPS